jgi:putative mRNA 3-end processing factor
MNNLISFTDKGLYCEKGDFFIDPWKPVDKAIITHSHSDHAYSGHKYYLCHTDTKPILQLRLGENNYQTLNWNEPIYLNSVKVSLHPAGHIIGSSQIRVECNGEVWVVSGDYKVEDDGISGKFEPVKCNTFITESTFGLPIYKWKPQQEIYDNIIKWINKNKENGKASIILAYSLGKAQRVLQSIKETTQAIYAHGAIFNMQQMLIDAGWNITEVVRVTPETPKELLKGAVVIAPPSADGTSWMKKFMPYSVGVCSGWMQVRGNARRRNVDAGFALSDHADWDGLLQTVKATGAERIFVTHGFQSAFTRYCNEEQIAIAVEVKTQYGNEEEEAEELLKNKNENETNL